MSTEAIAAIAYGLLAALGGIFGYMQARSKPSLISGLISGILLIIAGLASNAGVAWGLPLAVAIAALLVIVFIVRLIKTRKFMPAGVMIIAGAIALILMLQT